MQTCVVRFVSGRKCGSREGGVASTDASREGQRASELRFHCQLACVGPVRPAGIFIFVLMGWTESRYFGVWCGRSAATGVPRALQT